MLLSLAHCWAVLWRAPCFFSPLPCPSLHPLRRSLPGPALTRPLPPPSVPLRPLGPDSAPSSTRLPFPPWSITKARLTSFSTSWLEHSTEQAPSLVKICSPC